MSAPKDAGSCPPVPVNVSLTLFGNRVFADDQVKMGSLGWALIQYDFVLIKRGDLATDTHTDTHTHTHTHTRRTSREDEGRDWGDAYTSQGTPEMASEPPEARGQAWDRLFFTASEGNSPNDTWISDFQPPDCEKLNFYCCKPPSWWLHSPSKPVQVQNNIGKSLMGNRIFTQSQSIPHR